MNEVFIDMRNENKWVQKYFKKDYVSIEELIEVIQELDDQVDYWKNMYQDAHEERIIAQQEDAYDRWRDSLYDRE